MNHCNGTVIMNCFLTCVSCQLATGFQIASALLVSSNKIFLRGMTLVLVHPNPWCNCLSTFYVVALNMCSVLNFLDYCVFLYIRVKWLWKVVHMRSASQGFSVHLWHQYPSKHKFAVMASVLMKKSCYLVALMDPWFCLMKEEESHT